jgi:hypothetical protein
MDKFGMDKFGAADWTGSLWPSFLRACRPLTLRYTATAWKITARRFTRVSKYGDQSFSLSPNRIGG